MVPTKNSEVREIGRNGNFFVYCSFFRKRYSCNTCNTTCSRVIPLTRMIRKGK